MLKLTVFCILLIFIASVQSLGSNTFYADFYYANAEYGVGASFLSRVWYYNNGGNFIKMRVDYLYSNGSILQSQYFDWNTGDKYESCGTQCAHQTYTGAPPNFNTAVNYTGLGICPTGAYTGTPQCPSGCSGYQSSPNQPQGINQLGFNATGGMCLALWTINSPDTAANEWHIFNYVSSGFTSSQDPTVSTVYSNVILNLVCPKPTCQSVIDIALVLDESGSICDAHAYPAVQQFALAVVNAFNGSYGTNGTRMGLTYFSGLGQCENATNPPNWGTTSNSGCVWQNGQSNTGICLNCGGRWNTVISPPTTDESSLQSTIINHPIQSGATCLTCGVQQGAVVLNASPRPGVPRVMIFFTDGYDNK